ncbi:unnamed protein product [Cuscuta campestris]|uniref:TOD1/MUCI70 glycosyltransferase-like domain-containing protein n=1 Tax=Cuscuta campestris TaxID=132261 RepID=A0A484K672_9ASTE|nr:unnamed protein product [Cuscuta campestris]
MGMATTTSKPLLFHSKLLCISFLYLFTALSLAFYTLLSPTACLFRPSPYDPIQTSLFSYNASYGEHKHALPTHRRRPSCASPVLFSDYWDAVTEIKRLCRDSPPALGSGTLNYAHGEEDSFGGNFSVAKRFSYFDQAGDDRTKEIPCGFFKPFPVSKSDKTAMERCDGVVVASAVFNNHDKIRQPIGLGTQTLNLVCFFMFIDNSTLQDLNAYNLLKPRRNSHDETRLGVWRIVVQAGSLYENAAMNGVVPKYMPHRLFPNAKFSVWVDAKMQLAVDPLLLVHSLVVAREEEGVEIAVSRHPVFVHTMEEAAATARWRKWGDVGTLMMQMETYCEHGLQPWTSNKPFPSDVPDSAVIIRKHTKASNLFSCLMFNELEAFNPRDQLAFAYVRDLMNPKPRINMFDAEVLEQVAVEYRHNLKHGGGASSAQQVGPTVKMPIGGASFTKCDGYFLKMWGESND